MLSKKALFGLFALIASMFLITNTYGAERAFIPNLDYLKANFHNAYHELDQGFIDVDNPDPFATHSWNPNTNDTSYVYYDFPVGYSQRQWTGELTTINNIRFYWNQETNKVYGGGNEANPGDLIFTLSDDGPNWLLFQYAKKLYLARIESHFIKDAFTIYDVTAYATDKVKIQFGLPVNVSRNSNPDQTFNLNDVLNNNNGTNLTSDLLYNCEPYASLPPDFKIINSKPYATGDIIKDTVNYSVNIGCTDTDQTTIIYNGAQICSTNLKVDQFMCFKLGSEKRCIKRINPCQFNIYKLKSTSIDGKIASTSKCPGLCDKSFTIDIPSDPSFCYSCDLSNKSNVIPCNLTDYVGPTTNKKYSPGSKLNAVQISKFSNDVQKIFNENCSGNTSTQLTFWNNFWQIFYDDVFNNGVHSNVTSNPSVQPSNTIASASSTNTNQCAKNYNIDGAIDSQNKLYMFECVSRTTAKGCFKSNGKPTKTTDDGIFDIPSTSKNLLAECTKQFANK